MASESERRERERLAEDVLSQVRLVRCDMRNGHSHRRLDKVLEIAERDAKALAALLRHGEREPDAEIRAAQHHVERLLQGTIEAVVTLTDVAATLERHLAAPTAQDDPHCSRCGEVILCPDCDSLSWITPRAAKRAREATPTESELNIERETE